MGMNPPFAGVIGYGSPNGVDSHASICTQEWCLDSRPMDGGGGGEVGNAARPTLGSAGTPFVNVTGQLWKFAGASSLVNRNS